MSNEELIKEEHFENVVDIIRDVMHKWRHFNNAAEKVRAVKSHISDGEATASFLERRAEEHWGRIRPALRELLDGVDNSH